jgi:sporulation protein YabP
METSNTIKNAANLTLWNRKILNLSGIEDVISFDELSVYLVSKEGNLLVEGADLHITTLDISEGNMTIEGIVNSMVYHDKETAVKSGFFGKIFK